MPKLKLILNNHKITIQNAPINIARLLEKATSYLVQGHYFSPAFRSRRWDGREHLLVFKKGHYRAPIGLLGVIRQELDKNGIEYEVKRAKTRKPEKVEFIWNEEIRLRPYQVEAIEAFCKSPDAGRGILKMPIRSGKTKTAAGIIKRIGVKTLFLVPSQMLMYQTAKSLSESLPGSKVGMIGDGNWEEGSITVATIQTLGRLKGGTKQQCSGNKMRNESGVLIKGKYLASLAPCGRKRCNGSHNYKAEEDTRYRPLINNYDLAIMDEIHHLTGEVWHNVFSDIPAKYRLGLSATVNFDCKKENERGVIWLRACCGDIKYDVSTSELIEQGYLMRQHVEMKPIRKPNCDGEKWSRDLQNRCIYSNPVRNRQIVIDAVTETDKGYKVMIVTNRKSQIKDITEIMDKYGIGHVTVTGEDSQDVRDERVDDFKSGKVQIIIGTVFGEGVDIPEIESVIIAEGGQDAKATVQRMRNMTPMEGKTVSRLIDYWDDTNAYFRKHSRKRYTTYKSEPAFIVMKTWE